MSTARDSAAPDTDDVQVQYRNDWARSDAKKILQNDIVEGRIADWQPQRVYKDPERYEMYYKFYKYENFRGNLSRLRKSVKKGMSHSERDKKALDIYRQESPIQFGPRIWHRSQAQLLLRYLVQTEVEIVGMTPAEIRECSNLFTPYSKEEFRNHLSHEKSRHWKKMHEKEYSERVRFLKQEIQVNSLDAEAEKD